MNIHTTFTTGQLIQDYDDTHIYLVLGYEYKHFYWHKTTNDWILNLVD